MVDWYGKEYLLYMYTSITLKYNNGKYYEAYVYYVQSTYMNIRFGCKK